MQKNFINLDNSLGKGDTNKGTYMILGVLGSSVAQVKALFDKEKPIDSTKLKPQQQPQNLVNPFQIELSKLKTKARSLLKNGHNDAFKSAMNIRRTLEVAFKIFQMDKDHDKFKTVCTNVIINERPQLDKHRGWSQLLINLTILIITLGIGLLIKGAINLSQHKSFFFVHKTDSSKIVDQIQSKLHQ